MRTVCGSFIELWSRFVVTEPARVGFDCLGSVEHVCTSRCSEHSRQYRQYLRQRPANRFFINFVVVMAVCLGLTLPGAVQAQDSGGNRVLEEIIVTAQKRTQDLQDVPISAVVLSGQKILDADINDIEELQTYVQTCSTLPRQSNPTLAGKVVTDTEHTSAEIVLLHSQYLIVYIAIT